MELVKESPEIFEEFAEQRQRSFLVMKEVKDKGIPVVGAYCTYFPQEIAMAMGAVTVGLCSTSDETIPIAEKDLPKNLCPMVKASYGFAVSDKCPFFYFSDVVVGETTCDGKKKMYELMKEFKRKRLKYNRNRKQYSAESSRNWKKEFLDKASVVFDDTREDNLKIHFELWPEIAPIACGSVMRLAEKKIFDGRAIERLEPDLSSSHCF